MAGMAELLQGGCRLNADDPCDDCGAPWGDHFGFLVDIALDRFAKLTPRRNGPLRFDYYGRRIDEKGNPV